MDTMECRAAVPALLKNCNRQCRKTPATGTGNRCGWLDFYLAGNPPSASELGCECNDQCNCKELRGQDASFDTLY